MPLTTSMLPCSILKHACLDSHPSPEMCRVPRDTKALPKETPTEVSEKLLHQLRYVGVLACARQEVARNSRDEAGTEAETKFQLQDMRILWCRDVTGSVEQGVLQYSNTRFLLYVS